MRGRARRVVAVGLAVLCTLALAACSNDGNSTEALARHAVQSFRGARVKTIAGSFVDGVIPVEVKVTVASDGDASGSGTFDHFPVTFRRVHGADYVAGTGYWHWEHLRWWPLWPAAGSQWVRAYADPAANAFLTALTLGGSLATLREHPGSVTAGSVRRADGGSVVPLSYGALRYDVQANDDHRLLRVVGSRQRAGANLLSAMRLSITYGGTVDAAAPAAGQAVDPHDASTFPALYTDNGAVAPASCGTTGCTLTEKIGNNAGAPVGQSVLTVTYYEAAGDLGPLASCQAPIPAIPLHGQAQIGCTATGASLVAWTENNSYWWDTRITNPPYAT